MYSCGGFINSTPKPLVASPTSAGAVYLFLTTLPLREKFCRPGRCNVKSRTVPGATLLFVMIKIPVSDILLVMAV
jgi:hypothetical protein